MKFLNHNLTGALESLLTSIEYTGAELERIIDRNDDGSLSTPEAMADIAGEIADLQQAIDRVTVHLI
jgi:hypothetical protein